LQAGDLAFDLFQFLLRFQSRVHFDNVSIFSRLVRFHEGKHEVRADDGRMVCGDGWGATLNRLEFCSSHGRRSGIARDSPQGLKPANLVTPHGAAEAAPFQSKIN
jgi:hypothetical protein